MVAEDHRQDGQLLPQVAECRMKLIEINENGNLLGEGVNVAARLEALAPAGGICVSKHIIDQTTGKLDQQFANAGQHKLKNIPGTVEVFVWPEAAARQLRPRPKYAAWAAAALIA